MRYIDLILHQGFLNHCYVCVGGGLGCLDTEPDRLIEYIIIPYSREYYYYLLVVYCEYVHRIVIYMHDVIFLSINIVCK